MYILRMYSNDSFEEVKLTNRKYYLKIVNNKIKITTRIMSNYLLTLTRNKGKYVLKSNKFIFCHGFFIKNKVLDYDDNYVIDNPHKIAIYVKHENINILNQINIENVKELTIGKNPESNINLIDDKISANHALIFKMGDCFYISNKSHVNKTYVNGKIIEEIKLKDNDLITICNYDFVYKDNNLVFYFLPSNYVFNKCLIYANVFPYIRKNRDIPHFKEEKETIILELPKKHSFQNNFDFFSYISLFLSIGVSVATISSPAIFKRALVVTIPLICVLLANVIYKYCKNKKEYNSLEKDINKNYDSNLQLKTNYIFDKNLSLKKAYNKRNINNEEIISKASILSDSIWNYNLDEYLNIKLGNTNLDSNLTINLPEERENSEHYQKLLEIKENNAKITNVNYSIFIKRGEILTINGDEDDVQYFINNLILNIIYNYDYEECNMMLLTKKYEEIKEFSLLRHFRFDSNIMITDDFKLIKKYINSKTIFICLDSELIKTDDVKLLKNSYVIFANYSKCYNKISVVSGKGVYENINFNYEESNYNVISRAINSFAPLTILNSTDNNYVLKFVDSLNIRSEYISVDLKKSLRDYENILIQKFNYKKIKFLKDNQLLENKQISKLNVNNGDTIVVEEE